MPSNFTIECLPDEPIIVMTLHRRYHVVRESPAVRKQLGELIDDCNPPIYLITDFRDAKLDFADLVMQLGQETRGETGSLSDPRIKRNIFVGSDEIVEMAAHSLMQTQYGKVDVLMFRTLEQALMYVRAVMKRKSTK